MLRGLTTVTYLAGDVAAAVDWYTDLLGVLGVMYNQHYVDVLASRPGA